MNVTDSDIPDLRTAEQKSSTPNGTKVVFIGADLYSVATQHAIAVSYATGTQVSAAKFTQHLVETYGEKGVQSLSDFINSQPKA